MKNLKHYLIGGFVGTVVSLATFNTINFLTKPKTLMEHIDRIYLMEREDFSEDLPKNTSAYTFYDQKTEKINVVLQKNYGKRDFFHEVGHAKNISLDLNNSDFSEKWKQISNFEYGSILEQINWELGLTNLKNGILSEHSIESELEDVATFVEFLGYDKNPKEIEKLCKSGISELEEYSRFYPLYFADTTDHRYKQKLDLLKEYNFFTKEEHEKLSKDLGSLRYSLKEEK